MQARQGSPRFLVGTAKALSRILNNTLVRTLNSELSTSWRFGSEGNTARVFQGWLGCEMGKLLPLGTDGLQFSRCEAYRTEKHVCVRGKGDGD